MGMLVKYLIYIGLVVAAYFVIYGLWTGDEAMNEIENQSPENTTLSSHNEEK